MAGGRDFETAGFARTSENARAALLTKRSLLASRGLEYSRAVVKVFPRHVRSLGTTVILQAVDNTRMYFPKSTGPDFEEWKVKRAFTFTNGTGRPLLESARLQGDDANATVVDALAVGGSNASLSPLPSSAAPVQKVGPATARELAGKQTPGSRAKALAAYDYGAMINYARRYWDNYNSAYRAYSNDCTNFISQAMRAGGWAYIGSGMGSRGDSSKWYYGSYTFTTSYTWAGAHNWYWFARGSGRATHLSNVWYLLASDVLQIDFDRNNNISHTMIVTAVGSNGERYLTYHTNDHLNRPLTEILSAYPTAWYYAHRT